MPQALWQVILRLSQLRGVTSVSVRVSVVRLCVCAARRWQEWALGSGGQ